MPNNPSRPSTCSHLRSSSSTPRSIQLGCWRNRHPGLSPPPLHAQLTLLFSPPHHVRSDRDSFGASHHTEAPSLSRNQRLARASKDESPLTAHLVHPAVYSTDRAFGSSVASAGERRMHPFPKALACATLLLWPLAKAQSYFTSSLYVILRFACKNPSVPRAAC